MRTLDQCFYRSSAPIAFREEGRGLGFSIGGWHPFRANTYLPTLKKLDPLSNTSIGKAIWKPIEKVNQSVNKDFMKAKKWSQDHRKTLQIAAAVAAAAFGGAYYLGYLGTGAGAAASGAAGAAEAAAGAGEGVTTSAFMASETLAPLTASSVPSLSLVPATVPTATGAALTTTAASTGGGILSTLGGVTQSIAPLMALSKLIGGQAQPQQGGAGYGGYGGYGGYSGYGGGGGGGGALGPMGPLDQPMGPPAPSDGLPSWVLPAAGTALLIYLIKE
jgi:hypothetical protein